MNLPADELPSRLTTVRGIAPWTVHMRLLVHLDRPDVMPTDDFAIRVAFQRLYRKHLKPTPDAFIRHARFWQSSRSAASWYPWRSLDTSDATVN